jgi:aspartate/methionine/tyrosine aminotransferase
VIIMSIGDPDFDTPAEITDAAIAALRAGDTHYTGCAGRPPLRQAIAHWHSERTGCATEPGQVVAVAGAQCALYAALACICDPGDEVIMPEPAYVTYPAAIGAQGARVIRTPARRDGSLRPDIAAIEAALSPRTRAIVFASPNNPSGVTLDSTELAAIAELAQKHNCWVIQDEVYADLVFDSKAHSICALPGMAQRAVSVSSLSKSHAMTGWRVGWLVGPKPLADHAENLALCMLYGLPGFIQAAAQVALSSEVAEAAEMKTTYRNRRDLVTHTLNSGIGHNYCLTPAAGMFTLLDIRPTGLSGEQFCRQLYDQERVSVLDATTFGDSTAGYVRLSFADAEMQLREGCARIVRFYRKLLDR